MDNRMPANGSAHSADSVAPSSDAADALNGNSRSARPCHKRRLLVDVRTDVLMRKRRRLLLQP